MKVFNFQSAQDERETLLLKQEELNNQLTELRNAADSGGQEADRLSERYVQLDVYSLIILMYESLIFQMYYRVKFLEYTIEATHAEKKQIDQELALIREESNSRHIEINRLNTLLDNAKAKVSPVFICSLNRSSFPVFSEEIVNVCFYCYR